jgi:AGCS family alanine or glycine:cation symporter
VGTVLDFLDALEHAFGAWVIAPMNAVIFWDIVFWDDSVSVPVVVLWLILGAVYCTLRFEFINLRGFRHAVDCVRGHYSSPDDPGEISHFQALAAALSATVGLGNIAGVGVAVGLGGPGAIFWMVLAGVLGMSSKFAECTLGQKYRHISPEGRVSGGPMYYLRDGLAELGWVRTGKVMAAAFAVLCIGGTFGAGNMFQANQSASQMAHIFSFFEGRLGALVFGGTLALAVGIVIIGGIRRIGRVAASLVPFMVAAYVLCGLWILASNAGQIWSGFATIVNGAFTPEATYGGFVGVLIQGFRRAAFSNEAGVGSAPIAHSAAITREPVREGFVALLEPFIDTVVVCTMTGLVIVVTGAYAAPDAGEGILMTSWAFATAFPWFPIVLAFVASLFAFSTMISWSYYGERAWSYLFGEGSTIVYKVVFLAFAWFGAVSALDQVVEFSDLALFGMAFPNLAGVVILSGVIKRELDSYVERLRAGEITPRESS